MGNFELFEDEINAFPEPSEYFQRLKILDDYNFDGIGYEEIEKIYYKYAIILPSLIVRQPKEYFSDLLLYRVRLNIDNYDLNLVNTHSYPNSFFCKENGRCNLKGRTVMYCSDNPNAALYEVKPQVGDTGFLSVWENKKENPIKLTSLLPPDLPDGNRWVTFAKESNERHFKKWQTKYPDIFNSFKLLRAFIAEKFYSEKAPYYLSSFISNKLLYEELQNDMIIYRSVKVDGFYCNLAVHPNFCDEYLSLRKIVNFKLLEHKNDTYKFNVIRIGEFDEGRIKWRKRNETDEKDVFNLFNKET